MTDRPVPKHVAIIAHGASLLQYIWIAKGRGARVKLADETWAINAVADVIVCDRIFHMDDIAIQEIRAAANPDGNIAAMLPWLKKHPGPIYTSIVRDGYPGMVPFPLEDVINNLGYAYFNSTAAYAAAYAVHLGVEEISMWGCDFTYPKAHDAERGRGCVEYWLGQAMARGIKVSLPQRTSLLDSIDIEPDDLKLYGYDMVKLAAIEDEAGHVTIAMTPKPAPTAEEIEARYDHSKHPSPLMSGQAQEETKP